MSEQQSSMGKWMMVFAWISGLALLVLVFDEQLEAQFNPNRQPISANDKGVIEVKLQQNRSGHYVTNGTVNHEPVVFLLDTGATHVSVPQHLANRLQLKAGALYPVQTANGVINVAQTSIAQLAIGDIQLFDVKASINPSDQSDEILLGMSALRQLEFTQKGQWLILRSL
ncbi:MAG: TIGR02281 family clan AA aspartic protease [Paraglaciecola sp.]|uniref:retropepsin-like aspartic protease family protein n=1 Tax=Paraglaciecola sp. TaxID=1920173 RepID=UPI00273E4967|nr:TIGR02281 family clan AA aspartic protease [Paraglaciecola sp.]MDP5030328.1 TIGR02281 family clan AA aspartic protease [Paraglaciecola sp.]MDP5039506.1 TIGR02281 family clan AA aspartic protease [Paraglaciecola sp.]MDP5131505.1 TIGR02281 family clan AA aspartic protease [Paraglaciecola sp.]